MVQYSGYYSKHDLHRLVQDSVYYSKYELQRLVHYSGYFSKHDLQRLVQDSARLIGLGKATVIKHLQKGHKLEQLCEPNAALPEVIAEASSFVAACYGERSINMSNVRFDVWLTKMAQTPKLQSLPPTSESFSENV